MQRANIALAIAATLAVGCTEVQDLLGDITRHDGSGHGHGHGPGHGHGNGGSGGGPATPPPPSCAPTITADDLFATVARDLASLDADDQPFQRYVTLANQFNADSCRSFDADRQALVELFNTLSIEPTTSRPVPIDADQLTFRVDLRDYGWDRELEVDGRTFSDGWEAVIASSPFAIEYVGDDADDAKADSGTSVPLMSFDALADAASAGSVYYALIDVPDTSRALFLDTLAIDVDANRRDGDTVLAGTSQSRISRADRLFDRSNIEVRAGFIWRALDSFAESGNDIFQDPLSQRSDGSVTMFTLPNGLLGFAIFDGNGNRVDDSDILLDTNQNNFRAAVAVSCLNCHGPSGLLPIVDEVRGFVQANADDFDPALVADVERLFPPQAELDAVIARDSSDYTNARDNIGLGSVLADPLGGALLGFDLDLEVTDMAGDLWVTPEQFTDNLSLLPPILGTAIVDRDDFAAVYAEAVCVLASVNENVPADCN